GSVCAALPGDECEQPYLPPMHYRDGDRFETAYRVTVDLRCTGTVADLGAADAEPDDFARRGHMVRQRAQDGGVPQRPGHTEAAVDFARRALAGGGKSSDKAS
ncbi:3,4-dihydroxy-2-butanone-4-phosphate synthase, partial [Pseudonocardia sp.]|uniref:3,4-dihydroxy-2-butanone-4-phosphate synthase n=1 Tax=Pseudonocardia sp. TaxID=60912 RepID=UPI00262AE782